MLRRCTLFRHGSALGGQVVCKEKKKLVRNPNFKKVDNNDIEFFRSVLGKESKNAIAVTDLDKYNFDWFQDYKGEAPACLLPSSTEQVSEILKYCNKNKIAVVPQGGNTGFVGGSVPVFDEIVISTRRMNKVLEIDEISGTLKCQPGCILEELDNEVKAKGFLMPVDLGAKGSCLIGGNISTNAGGLRVMRYGNLHGVTLGLTVVLPTGEILDLMNVLKKDNTGYDLKHLFIGHEGTLGIITEVALQLATKPNAINTMFLGAKNWEALCNIFVAARKDLGEILSAAEMIDGQALDLVCQITKTNSPLPDSKCPYYMLLETNGSNQEHDQAKLFAFLEKAMETGLVESGTVAENSAQTKHIWSMREGCATAPNAIGHVRWYDISMPSKNMAAMIEGARAALKENGLSETAKCMGFGHFGDGNLHINLVTIPEYNQRVVDIVDGFMYNHSKEHKYSVSAEHGIGLQKKSYLPYTKPQATLDHMINIKKMFDPNSIMNPYKVFQ
jgi:FAD/FMN-containing dehydrogenase